MEAATAPGSNSASSSTAVRSRPARLSAGSSTASSSHSRSSGGSIPAQRAGRKPRAGSSSYRQHSQCQRNRPRSHCATVSAAASERIVPRAASNMLSLRRPAGRRLAALHELSRIDFLLFFLYGMKTKRTGRLGGLGD
eukprot:scaffold2516_cov108-Isochrysis_galbana.AAC.10